MKTRFALLIVALIVVATLYALFVPTAGFHPVAWRPTPTADATTHAGPMPLITRLAAQAGTGPETVIIGPDGALYAGYDDGTVHRFALNGDHDLASDTIVATTNGRPLGLAFGPALPGTGERHTTLYIADAEKGLLAAADDGTTTTLTDRVGDSPLRFTDGITVARDGTIYFTDASSRWPQGAYQDAIMEHGGHGRLLAYDPATRQTRVLMDGLQFANGVALAHDQQAILVNETGAYRVQRYWLAGPQQGQHETLIDGLPGFPDGLARSPDGKRFWIALFAPRERLLDFAADKPALRRLTWRLPHWLQPGPTRVAQVLAIDAQGHVVANLRDDERGAYAPITSVAEFGDTLYFGSLKRDAIGRIAWQAPHE